MKYLKSWTDSITNMSCEREQSYLNRLGYKILVSQSQVSASGSKIKNLLSLLREDTLYNICPRSHTVHILVVFLFVCFFTLNPLSCSRYDLAVPATVTHWLPLYPPTHNYHIDLFSKFYLLPHGPHRWLLHSCQLQPKSKLSSYSFSKSNPRELPKSS